MPEFVVRAEKLGKRYRRTSGELRYRTLRSVIANAARDPIGFVRRRFVPEDMFWALRNVSLEVKPGERIGIIGRNGAGKSTLLKILSRITDPTEGRAVLQGRVGSLLEVGTGFHPELTGRENVYLSGAILGMSRADIRRRFDQIVAFAEIEKFLDLQAKHYSSGMYMRLAFSVAAHMDPEILIVDEVLAVGDISFQEKCLGKMSEAARDGRTVIFVSHNMAAVAGLCTRAYLIQSGTVTATGTSQEVIDAYLSSRKTAPVSVRERTDRRGTGRVRQVGFELIGNDGLVTDTIATGGDVTFVVHYEAREKETLARVSVNLRLVGQLGENRLFTDSDMVGATLANLPSRGKLVLRFGKFPMVPGRYDVDCQVTVNGEEADWVQRISTVNVAEGDFYGTGRLPPDGHGWAVVPHTWSFAEET